MTDTKDSAIPKTPFDTLISHAQLDILKLLLPYTPPSQQRFMATFIKLQELERTMKYFDKFPSSSSYSADPPSPLSTDFLIEIRPYLGGADGGIIDTLVTTMSMMELFQNMTPNDSDSETNGFSLDFLKSMLSPEQQAMMDAFNAASYDDECKKGDFEDGQQMDESSTNEWHGSDQNGTD